MTQTNINISMDDDLKRDFDTVCAEMGLTMTAAFTVFAKAVTKKRAMPFEVSKPTGKHAKLGGWEGKIWMSDDFNEPM